MAWMASRRGEGEVCKGEVLMPCIYDHPLSFAVM